MVDKAITIVNSTWMASAITKCALLQTFVDEYWKGFQKEKRVVCRAH